LEQAQGGDAQTQQMVADYYHIAGALQRHPDLAQELDRRVVAEQGTAPAQPTTRQPAQPTTPPPWAQKLGETVEQVNQRLTAAEQAQLAAHQRAESAKTEKELDAVCTKFLEDRGYDRSFLEDAKEYVLKKAEKEMPDLELEDVPYVLSAWFKNTDGKIQARVNSILEGKRSDAGLPPSPGSAHTAVRPAQAAGANDGSTAQQAEEALRRLGWSND
jgi:gamma-glutamylcysteine synthetase